MKVKVIKPFKDKHTKVIFQPDQVVEVTKERFEELSSSALVPFVEAVTNTPEKKQVKNQKTKTTKAKK